ncbi:MAG: T9SS type A sorting domain-containing protein [Bacteroidota bacterium]
MALAVLACAAALMLGACDSSTTEPTDERFGIAVVAETPGGEPVVGLRVAIRPCIDVNLTGGQGDPCVADAPTAPTQPAAIAKTSGVTYQGFEVETSGLLLEALLFFRWRTTMEVNNRGFEVQIREASAEEYEVLGFVEGAGTIEELQFYEFRITITVGSYVLRLRQEDLDGTSTFSDEVPVTYEAPPIPSSRLTSVYPNPFTDQTTLDYFIGDESPNTRVDIVDLAGNVVYTNDEPLQPARGYRIQWTAEGVPSGVYTVRVRVDDEVVGAFAVARWAVLPDDAIDGSDVRGATNAMGTFETLDVMLAPAFYGPDELEYRGLNNELLGTFALPERVRVTLIDPATGAQQAYDRAIVDGPNTFALTWDQ